MRSVKFWQMTSRANQRSLSMDNTWPSPAGSVHTCRPLHEVITVNAQEDEETPSPGRVSCLREDSQAARPVTVLHNALRCKVLKSLSNIRNTL